MNWGILGCGFIAKRMVNVLQQNDHAVITAVAARNKEKANQFCQSCGLGDAVCYDSYEALAHDPSVQAVYVATIHPTHFEAVKLCLLAGKAVLCEKPLTMTAAESEELYALSKERGVLLLEAMWTRFLPAWLDILERIKNDEIGDIRHVTADFSGYMPFNPQSRAFDPALGGGALLDLGVYCIHTAFMLLGYDYETVHAVGRTAQSGVDSYALLTLQYPGGTTASLTCAVDMAGSSAAAIYGTKGRIDVPNFFMATSYTITTNGESMTYKFPEIDGFTYEVEEMHRLMEAGKTQSQVVTPKDTIASMKLIEYGMKAICNNL